MKTDNIPTQVEKELAIDPNALDIEWLGQAELYFKYASAAVLARKEADEAKTALDVVEAEAQTKVREKPEIFGITKVTETAINTVVTQNDKVLEAQERLQEAKHTLGLLDAAVYALDHRKRALESLVQLHLGAYFAGPKEPRNLSTGVIEKWKRDRVQQTINTRLNEKKKEK